MIKFDFTNGRMCPLLYCDACGERVRDNTGLVGCADLNRTAAIVLHKGICDRVWQKAHGRLTYWQEVGEFLLHLAFNASPPADDWLEKMPPSARDEVNEWREIRPRIAPMVFKRDGHACVYCGATKRLTVDHVIPLSRGGGHELHNLVTACRSCNASKNAKTPKQWRGEDEPDPERDRTRLADLEKMIASARTILARAEQSGSMEVIDAQRRGIVALRAQRDALKARLEQKS